MPGARLELELRGLPEVSRRLSRLAERMGDPTPALNEVGEALLNSTRERFRSRKAPDGTPWAPLSEATKQAKPKNKGKVLVLEGQLMRSLNYEADRDGLLFGSPEVYAGTHQFGREARPGEGLPFGGAAIPARPFLGLSAEDIARIDEIFDDWLDPA